MRLTHVLALFSLLVFLAIGCTPTGEDDPQPADFSDLITGTYQYTTSEGGSETGSGTAIITKEGNNTILIVLEDGIRFKAHRLQRVDNDLIMEVPSQAVDYYGMDAQFSGQPAISRQGQQYEGVYFGQTGELRMGLNITIGSATDRILLVLDR